MFKLKITYKDQSIEPFEDEFQTVEEAHEVRRDHGKVIADPVWKVEIFEVDDKGYRVVGQDIIYFEENGLHNPNRPADSAQVQLNRAVKFFEMFMAEFTTMVEQSTKTLNGEIDAGSITVEESITMMAEMESRVTAISNQLTQRSQKFIENGFKHVD
jgi:hypothetical protein